MECPNKKNLKESGFCKEKYKGIDKEKIKEVEQLYLNERIANYIPCVTEETLFEVPGKALLEIEDYIDKIAKEDGRNRDMVAICEMAIKYLELVQEMKANQNLHDGWIPVEKRLPTKEEYLKDDGRFICDDGNRRYQGLFDIYDGKFKFSKHISGLKFELIEDKCVIAWRPLPEPYKND